MTFDEWVHQKGAEITKTYLELRLCSIKKRKG